ncbi:reverse transcriptase [Gossypium australe]|uniref:Reverse transcriptase n=1 Tax=Gossypium australe TaxID=47621 RepID=A0A5B6VQM9_9ROSI|nr:reverse transcriptase [Gossypium australe]
MCRSKEEGGMGFRNMAKFNISLLAKQGWRIMNNTESLAAKATKDILRKGLIWRVGTGNNISVNCDAWIPNGVNFRLLSEVELMPDQFVSTLIDNNERIWKEDLIEDTFDEEDTVRILQISLADVPHDDYLAWGGEASGVFSVRSAYKLLQTTDEFPRAYALQISYRNLYKKLWLLNLPTKIKITVWKITWNFLPTRCNPRAWRLFCCALWALWGDRNLRIHEKKVSTGSEIGNFVIRYIAELDGLERKKLTQTEVKPKWRHPPRETIKINFDGAFDVHNHISASGIVIRDPEGAILFSCSEIHKGVPSAFAAEALACRKAVRIGVENRWTEVIIEEDSRSVINKCRSSDRDKSLLGAYISDIKQMMYRSKPFVFNHIPRSANTIAHEIATESLKSKVGIYLEGRVSEYAENQRLRESVREPD